MKKIFLSVIGLLIISMCVSSASASDNTSMTHDAIQTIDLQDMPVDSPMTIENTAYNHAVNVVKDVQTVNNDDLNVLAIL